MLHKKKRRFLMIERQRDWYETVKEAFRRQGKIDYEIIWVKEGKEALKMLKMNRIDAVILEILLPTPLTDNPTKEGIELCKQIRKNWPELPIIVLTIMPAEVASEETLAAGAIYYITKPFDPIELDDKLIFLDGHDITHFSTNRIIDTM